MRDIVLRLYLNAKKICLCQPTIALGWLFVSPPSGCQHSTVHHFVTVDPSCPMIQAAVQAPEQDGWHVKQVAWLSSASQLLLLKGERPYLALASEGNVSGDGNMAVHFSDAAPSYSRIDVIHCPSPPAGYLVLKAPTISGVQWARANNITCSSAANCPTMHNMPVMNPPTHCEAPIHQGVSSSIPAAQYVSGFEASLDLINRLAAEHDRSLGTELPTQPPLGACATLQQGQAAARWSCTAGALLLLWKQHVTATPHEEALLWTTCRPAADPQRARGALTRLDRVLDTLSGCLLAIVLLLNRSKFLPMMTDAGAALQLLTRETVWWFTRNPAGLKIHIESSLVLAHLATSYCELLQQACLRYHTLLQGFIQLLYDCVTVLAALGGTSLASASTQDLLRCTFGFPIWVAYLLLAALYRALLTGLGATWALIRGPASMRVGPLPPGPAPPPQQAFRVERIIVGALLFTPLLLLLPTLLLFYLYVSLLRTACASAAKMLQLLQCLCLQNPLSAALLWLLCPQLFPGEAVLQVLKRPLLKGHSEDTTLSEAAVVDGLTMWCQNLPKAPTQRVDHAPTATHTARLPSTAPTTTNDDQCAGSTRPGWRQPDAQFLLLCRQMSVWTLMYVRICTCCTMANVSVVAACSFVQKLFNGHIV